MNEPDFGRRITQILDGGLELPPPDVARLDAARARAVAAQRRTHDSPIVVLADGVTLRLGGPGQWFLHVLLPAALLVVGMLSLHYWNESRDSNAADVEELDSQILKGDLPIDAYLDRGFQAWLKRSSE